MDHEIDKQEPSGAEGGEMKVGGETSCPSLAIGQQVKVVYPRHAYDGKRGTIIGFSGIKEGEAVYEVQIEGEAIAAGLRRSSLVKVEAACGDMQVGDKVWVLCEVAMVYNHESLYVDIRHDGAVFEAKRSDCRPVEPVNSPKILDSSSEPMRASFEADMVKRYGEERASFARNENRYFDSSMEIAWQAFQSGAKYGNPSGWWEPSKDEVEYAMDRCGVPASDPLAPSPCMDGVDVDQFIDGAMEARGRVSEPLRVGDSVRFVLPRHERHGTEGVVTSEVDLVSSGCNYWFESNCGKFSCYCSASQLERINKSDPINPSHYKQGGIECIEAIKAATGDGFIGYVWGNVLKYLWRWPKKGGVDDLKKARWYLDRLIKEAGE